MSTVGRRNQPDSQQFSVLPDGGRSPAREQIDLFRSLLSEAGEKPSQKESGPEGPRSAQDEAKARREPVRLAQQQEKGVASDVPASSTGWPDYTGRTTDLPSREQLEAACVYKEGKERLQCLQNRYNDFLGGRQWMSTEESLRVRGEINKLTGELYPNQKFLSSGLTDKQEAYLAQKAYEERRSANRLGIAFLGPVAGGPAAMADLAGAPNEAVENLGEVGMNLTAAHSVGGRPGAVRRTEPRFPTEPVGRPVNGRGGSEPAGKTEPEVKTGPAGRSEPGAPAEGSAQKWFDDLRNSLPPEAQKKLDGVRRQHKSVEETQKFVESKGGPKFFEGGSGSAKPSSDSASLTQFEVMAKDQSFLNRPGVKKALEIADPKQREAAIRSELAAESALKLAKQDYASEPGATHYEEVMVLREQPGFKTEKEYRDANPKYRGPVYVLGEKVYKPETDIDLLVTKKVENAPETILQSEQIKSGVNDTPGEAQDQLDKVHSAFKSLANGDPSIRLVLGDGTDVTGRFNHGSIDAAKNVTRGPVSRKAGWTETLGVTADDLLSIAKTVSKKE